MDPGEGLQRRAGEHRREPEQLGRDPDGVGGHLVAGPLTHLGEGGRRALQHRARVRPAQQRLGGHLGRGAAQAAVAEHHVDAVAGGRVGRRDAFERENLRQRIVDHVSQAMRRYLRGLRSEAMNKDVGRRARSFGGVAESYHRGRPGYGTTPRPGSPAPRR